MTGSTPFFTIGVPVYNAQKYLPMCIESILNQSFRDFELILVNDGSKDNSLDVCRSYALKDDRIIVIDQENAGVSAASNRILDAARGEYLYLMDNDDEMYEGILEKVYGYLSEEPVDILHGGYYVSSPGEELKLRLCNSPNVTHGFADRSAYLKYCLDFGYFTSMWTKYVRKSFWINSNVRFKTEYNGYQDYDVSFRIMEKANTIRYVQDVFLTWYHPREGSISTEWSWTMMRNCWRSASSHYQWVLTPPRNF